MKKVVGIISVILIIVLFFLYQKDSESNIDYNSDVLIDHSKEIEILFGDIKVLNKERITETFNGFNLTKTINYDAWEFEYMNRNQITKHAVLKNRYDFVSSISEIILAETTKDINDLLDLDFEIVVNYENAPTDLDSIENIEPELYPINLKLDNLPDDFLIVLSPLEGKVKEFNDSMNDMLVNINRAQIKNVLLLRGDKAYQMDYGILVIDGSVMNEKISVEVALKWIELNR